MPTKYKYVECFCCGEEHDKCSTEIVDGEFICCNCLKEGGGREEIGYYVRKIKERREKIKRELSGPFNWGTTIETIKQNCKL